MKRLFVRAAFRGRALGRLLAERLVAEAAALGYTRMLLDTVPARMTGAVRLYCALGFREVSAYYDTPPVPGVSYMELELPPVCVCEGGARRDFSDG
jgi:ribosomal protein S18 acetylase RimI-like enzyme